MKPKRKPKHCLFRRIVLALADCTAQRRAQQTYQELSAKERLLQQQNSVREGVQRKQDQEGKPAAGTSGSGGALREGWKEVKDAKTGATYYWNKVGANGIGPRIYQAVQKNLGSGRVCPRIPTKLCRCCIRPRIQPKLCGCCSLFGATLVSSAVLPHSHVNEALQLLFFFRC